MTNWSISTAGFGSSRIVAQSIGGSGGTGGNALAASVTMAVGGTGGDGGHRDHAYAANLGNGLVTARSPELHSYLRISPVSLERGGGFPLSALGGGFPVLVSGKPRAFRRAERGGVSSTGGLIPN